jgi:hypothetical protein
MAFRILLEVLKMDMRKLQVRADIERMVINYSLMNMIETQEADRIITILDSVLGRMPARPAGQYIIPFPVAVKEKPRHTESEPNYYSLARKIAEELGVAGLKYIGFRAVSAIASAKVRSVEELAAIPSEELALCHNAGYKVVNAISEALKVWAAKNNEKLYFLTADCFKTFCMMPGNGRGKEIRRYIMRQDTYSGPVRGAKPLTRRDMENHNRTQWRAVIMRLRAFLKRGRFC